MKLIFTIAILAHSVLAGGDGPTTEQRIAGNGVAEKRHVVVNNIIDCISAYKTHAVADGVTVMKTACSCAADTADSGVDAECAVVKTTIKEFAVATGECADATVCADEKTTAIIEEMLLTNPRLLAKINSDYPVDYSSVNGGAAAVEAIIGTNIEDIKEYRSEQAADDIAKAIDICRRTRAGSLKPPLPDAAQSVKTAYNDAAPKSAAQKKTCSTTLDAGGEVAGRTDVKEAYELVKGETPGTVTDADVQAAVFDAADKLIAEEATKCSKDNKPSAEQGGTNDNVTKDAARKDCVDALADRYEAITGKSMDEAGLKNVLSKGASKEVGYEVKACVDSIASTVTGAAKALAGKVCRTGDAAKKALAEAMGQDAADITDTDVVKATREGAKEAGVAAMKAGKTLTEARADIAATTGKLTGSACEAKATWTKDCLTDIDVKKMIEKEAGECMKTSIASCKQVAVDVAICGATSLAVKADLAECRGVSAVELTDTDVKKMEKKSNSRDIATAIKNRASGTSKEDGEYQFFSKQHRVHTY